MTLYEKSKYVIFTVYEIQKGIYVYCSNMVAIML